MTVIHHQKRGHGKDHGQEEGSPYLRGCRLIATETWGGYLWPVAPAIPLTWAKGTMFFESEPKSSQKSPVVHLCCRLVPLVKIVRPLLEGGWPLSESTDRSDFDWQVGTISVEALEVTWAAQALLVPRRSPLATD